jgi:lantibiotic modifying enzyme
VSTDTSDSGLCHGIAGIAHLFNRLYQASGDARLGDAARRWFRRLIDLRYTRPGLAGFWSASSPAESGDATFLTGVTGVGLALLGAATSIEPEWDRVLLTDV